MEQCQETGFLLLSGFMVIEVELINRQFFGKGGLAPPEVDGVVPAVLQFEVRQEMERRDLIEFLCGLSSVVSSCSSMPLSRRSVSLSFSRWVSVIHASF